MHLLAVYCGQKKRIAMEIGMKKGGIADNMTLLLMG